MITNYLLDGLCSGPRKSDIVDRSAAAAARWGLGPETQRGTECPQDSYGVGLIVGSYEYSVQDSRRLTLTLP